MSTLAVDNITDEVGTSTPTFPNGAPAQSGQVAFFAMNTAPSGWLKANGAAVSRTTYSDLFNAIGTTFGAGDGTSTFNLPDLRGEFIRGWDDGRGVDSGRTFGSSQSDEFKSHTHTITTNFILGTTDTSRPALRADGGGGTGAQPSWTASSTGGSETRPRNVALLACIKY